MRKSYLMVTTSQEFNDHHRRPRSLDGSQKPSNVSYVPVRLHRYWHTLFGNMNAFQICNKINTRFKPEGVTVICKFINGSEVTLTGGQESKNPNKEKSAWKHLFGDLTFSEIIDYINGTWLDPSYHLYIIN